MFAKPYKLKSNNTLKNSEKKHLAQWMEDEFPAATEETVKRLVPVKSNTSCMKLVLHSGDTVGLYVVDGVPTMLEVGGRLVPTVCALWAAPDLLPTLTIHSIVHQKVASGAPLYVPGVVRTPEAVAEFPAGALVAARTDDNAAAALVGRAALSSADLMFRDSGVCLEPLHVFGDQLCRDARFGKLERPARPSPAPPAPRGPAPAQLLTPAHTPAHTPAPHDALAAAVKQLSIKKPPVKAKEEWPSLGRPEPPQPAPPAAVPVAVPAAGWPGLSRPAPEAAPAWGRAPVAAPRPALIAESPPPRPHEAQPRVGEAAPLEDTIDEDASEGEGGAEGVPSDMEQLLRWCLLTFLQLEGKSVELPLKTNLLYRNHLIPLCPPDRTLDVKKSSYKKVGKFLDAMQQEGLVEVRELEYGVDAVVRVQLEHPALRAHRLPAALRAHCRQALAGASARGGDAAPEYVPPRLRDVYCVTAAVGELLAAHRKGAALSAAEVRAAVTQYVTARGLAAQQPRGLVQLDAVLAALTGRRPGDGMKWEDLLNAVHNKMTPSTELRLGDGSVRLARTRLEPIRMQVASRSGNKKVTLVSNLEAYGFSLPELAAVSQRGVAASCGVTRSPGAKADQLMLQGDQTYFVAKLLIEKYGLPKKYVEGADKALKKKK